jgi:SOS-response transcriptional repressor LexA
MNNDTSIKLAFKNRPTADIHTVEIMSDDYKHFGLNKSYLAIVEERQAQQGDFAAVVGTTDEFCGLGFLGSSRGTVTLKTSDTGEPFSYDAKAVRVLGVVTGYCRPDNTDKDGNLLVIPVNFREVQSA